MFSADAHHEKLVVTALLMAFCCLFGLAGCSKPQSKPLKIEKKQDVKKSPPPKELSQLQTGLDKVYMALEPKPPGEGQSRGQGENKKRSGKQQDKSRQQQGQQSGQQGGGTADQRSQEPYDWAKIKQEVIRLHQLWNAFEPQAMKSGADMKSVSSFESHLNDLPSRLLNKDRYGAQLAANGAAACLPDFMQLFESKSPPDLWRLRYLARDLLLKTEDGDWSGAERDLQLISSLWFKSRAGLPGSKSNQVSKAQYALTDLENSVKTRDRWLVMLKEKIFEKNLDNLTKQ